jgi:phosphatidate cytidylyltransferase
MLKLRVLTALIAAPAVLAAIFFLPLLAFSVVFLALAGLGLLEWANLAGLRNVAVKAAYLAGYAVLGYWLWHKPELWAGMFSIVAMFWLCAAVAVLTFPASGRIIIGATLLPTGYVVFVGAWLALVALLARLGPWSIVWVFVVVWAADIGAYFAGRRFGRRKLALSVSPGKTWEGAVGGVLLSVLLGALFGSFVPALAGVGLEPWQWGAVALIAAVISVFGDLFESALKRARGVKDSGNLFPGHGGMLDRIDSLIAVLPCVAWAVAQQP